jgi:succinate dehydrogenase/fumarate reductase cytochrome b subunit
VIRLLEIERRADRPDDLSGDAHRRLIGWIGLLCPRCSWASRSSATASRAYYTGAVTLFVGMLVGLALFLFTYRGFDNAYHKADRAVAIIAGAAALVVALFPTAAPAGMAPLAWWRPWTGVLHHAAAIVLFAMFAVFALWLFRLRPDGKTQTRGWRNKVYVGCGALIIACIAWAGVNGYAAREIFVPESIALVAFSFSWLLKGYADEALLRLVGKPTT